MRTRTIQDLIQARRWKAGDGGTTLDSADNYMGADLSDWVTVVTRHRDADLLTESNFDAALKRLGGEGRSVAIHRIGNWACGWVELLQVRVTAKAKLQVALDIVQDLEAYPVLDEQDFSDREYEAAVEWIMSEGDCTREDAESVYSWLWDNEQSECEATDGTGATPSRESIERALAALKKTG